MEGQPRSRAELRPALAAPDVHLWLTRPEAARDPALLARYRALLSPAELARQGALALERARHAHLVTRALVRTVLSRYADVAPEAWRFVSGPFGKPEAFPPRGLRFNASNSPGLVACAVARGAVGVDVEEEARAGTVLEGGELVLSPAELDDLARLPPAERRARALTLWTLKEAYAKARGGGLSLPLRALTFRLDGPREIRAELGPALADSAARWRFLAFRRGPHAVALAAERVAAAPLALRLFETTPLVDDVAPEAEPPPA